VKSGADRNMEEKKEKIRKFLTVVGRAVLEGIPWVGSSLGIIIDAYTEDDLKTIIRKIEEFEKTSTKAHKEIEEIVFEILSMSRTFTLMWNERKKNMLSFEAERVRQIYEFEKMLLYDGPIERIFYEKNKGYLDEGIKKDILSGNLKGISSGLLNEYIQKGISADDPKSVIRSYLMLSDYFHISDEYEDSKKAFETAQGIAKEKNIEIEDLLVDLPISYGHILLHLNDLEGAKSIFQQSISNEENRPILKARDLFRIGEIFVFQGEYDEALKSFNQSIAICDKYLNTGLSQSAYYILADNYRRVGTAYRLKNDYETANAYYNRADRIYNQFGFRGRVWLLHGIGELYRAEKKFDEALNIYEQAKIESQKVCNINRVAHALLGICEVNRMMKKINLNDYAKPLEIYSKINSKWGIANTYISQSRAYMDHGKMEDAKRLLDIAKTICQELKLSGELELIQKVMEGSVDELHPLSLF
jgi:tetratricopeptide (TPR) repeat protein